ncbi:MAG: LytTR family DNA-binding domain-containing protein [Spirosomaceae bacterium]|jgi:two-component system LytT family response regulator|nr:LytTR family DNA-binding domain-containing protein [Spirosomataceae bacterium]
MMQKVIIIDDEASGRTLIKQYLADYPTLIVVGEANNGVDAIKVINEFKPDIVFMDIQMPGLTGFDVLKHLEEIPQIIFSTAYDQYALQAFEVHAIDYLLKPYTCERFRAAIQKLRTNQSQNLTPIQPLAESIINPLQYPEKILIQQNQKLITINVKEIIWIEAEGDYSKVITNRGSFLSNYGISILENKLNAQNFIRVHRSSIINLEFVKEIQKQISSYDVIMQNGDVVRVSRGYMDNIKKLTY